MSATPNNEEKTMTSLLFALLVVMFPACETEDSTNCYWDGGHNNAGMPFVDINGQAIYPVK